MSHMLSYVHPTNTWFTNDLPTPCGTLLFKPNFLNNHACGQKGSFFVSNYNCPSIMSSLLSAQQHLLFCLLKDARVVFKVCEAIRFYRSLLSPKQWCWLSAYLSSATNNPAVSFPGHNSLKRKLDRIASPVATQQTDQSWKQKMVLRQWCLGPIPWQQNMNGTLSPMSTSHIYLVLVKSSMEL